MKYQELMKEVEGVGKLKLSEQENFYRDVLNESSNDLEAIIKWLSSPQLAVEMKATFCIV